MTETENNELDQILAEDDIVVLVKRLYQRFPQTASRILKLRKLDDLHLIRRIGEMLPALDDGYTLATKVYWILHDMREFPLCECCGKPLTGVNVRNVSSGYGLVFSCGKTCLHKLIYRKSAESNTRKYGAANPFQFSKDKIRRTCLEKYGTDCYVRTDGFKSKAKLTNVKKYGVEFYQSTDQFKARIKQTNLKKYGVECALQSKRAKEKARKTNLERYGCEDCRQSRELQDRTRRRLAEKYGEDYGKILYGGNGNSGQSRRAYRNMLASPSVEPMFTESEYVEARRGGVRLSLEFKCRKCGKTYLSDWDNGRPSKKCPHCGFAGGISAVENKLLEFVCSIYSGRILTNSRSVIKPFELDEYIEEKKLAIELDGLYWHNDETKPDPLYHLNKTEMCEKLGIRLIHIFDSEWILKNEIVKSRIMSLFGIYGRTIYARSCEVRVLHDKSESGKFQDENHIQGAVWSSIDIGLYYRDELVSLMTFGKCRFGKRHEWELLRFCSKLNTRVVGGAGKLLGYFEKTYNPRSLVTYVDRRWSDGKLYNTLGFNFVHNSGPNYWYFKKNTIELQPKAKFQECKLKDLLEKFDPSRTEVQNMKDNGYFRVFDCGNAVFEKVYSGVVR